MAQEQEERKVDVKQEEVIVKQAIQSLFTQYLGLFTRGKIYDIKKLHKLLKQINNYVYGFRMKSETAPEGSKERLIAGALKDNEIVITVNILRAIVRFNLIRKVDNLTIEHDV